MDCDYNWSLDERRERQRNITIPYIDVIEIELILHGKSFR